MLISFGSIAMVGVLPEGAAAGSEVCGAELFPQPAKSATVQTQTSHWSAFFNELNMPKEYPADRMRQKIKTGAARKIDLREANSVGPRRIKSMGYVFFIPRS